MNTIPDTADSFKPFGALARALVLAQIEAETDLSEKKARIMLAWEHGHLTPQEAEAWIRGGGMAEA